MITQMGMKSYSGKRGETRNRTPCRHNTQPSSILPHDVTRSAQVVLHGISIVGKLPDQLTTRGISDKGGCLLPCPLPSGRLITGTIGLVQMGNIRHQRVIGVGIGQH